MELPYTKGEYPVGRSARKRRGIPPASVVGIALTLLLIGFAAATFAYFHKDSKTENRFQTPPYDVTIEEEFIPNEWGDDPITKKVTLTNTGEAPAVVRVAYAEMWTDENGSPLNALDIVLKNWAPNWGDPQYWTDGGDGWYYYNRVVEPGDRVGVLRSVQLNPVLTPEQKEPYINGKYQLDFICGSVQADAAAVIEVWGLSAQIDDGAVVWQFD